MACSRTKQTHSSVQRPPYRAAGSWGTGYNPNRALGPCHRSANGALATALATAMLRKCAVPGGRPLRRSLAIAHLCLMRRRRLSAPYMRSTNHSLSARKRLPSGISAAWQGRGGQRCWYALGRQYTASVPEAAAQRKPNPVFVFITRPTTHSPITVFVVPCTPTHPPTHPSLYSLGRWPGRAGTRGLETWRL